ADVARQAQQVGITVSLELHDDGLLDTPERCLQFIEDIGASNVGVNPDLGNLCRGSGPLSDWKAGLRLLASRTVCWHVKNYRNGRPAPIWDGDIDYDWAFGVMRGVRYEGWVSIESHCSGLESQKQELEYLKRIEAIPASVQAG